MVKIDKLKEILLSLKEVKFAYLFGSYAKQTQNLESDIDIAVYIKDNLKIQY